MTGGAGERMCRELGEIIRIGRWRGGHCVGYWVR
jgi:hypothetical protein